MSRNRYGMELKRIENNYHRHVKFLDPKWQDLPRIGFVRNPWAWYPSWLTWAMHLGDVATCQVFSGGLNPKDPQFFTDTVKRLLSIDDGTDSSKQYRKVIERYYKLTAPIQLQKSFMTPYCYAVHAEEFKGGYFTWWYRSMYYGIFDPEPDDSIEIGQIENFSDDFLRMVGKHVDLSTEYIDYVKEGQSQRVRKDKFPFQDHYDFELAALIAQKDGGIINRFGYQFNEEEKLA